MWADNVDSAPGSVSQVRAAAHELTRFAKRTGRQSSLSAMSPRKARSPGRAWSSTWWTPCSISRASAATSSASCAPSRTASVPADEIGVFEMTGDGLAEVGNPSALFLSRTRRARARDRWSSPGSRARARCCGDPGAGRAHAPQPAAPVGGGLGRRAPGDDPRRARIALRHPVRGVRRLSQRRRRLRVRRARPPTWLWPRRYCRRARTRPCPRTVVFGEISLSGPCARRPDGKQVERSAQTWFLHRDPAGATRPAGAEGLTVTEYSSI